MVLDDVVFGLQAVAGKELRDDGASVDGLAGCQDNFWRECGHAEVGDNVHQLIGRAPIGPEIQGADPQDMARVYLGAGNGLGKHGGAGNRVAGAVSRD